MKQRPAYAAPYFVFEGFGHIDSVVELLEQAHIGIGYDAQNSGGGQFAEITVISLETDISLVDKGEPNRVLPADAPTSSGIKVTTRLIPPYYLGTKVDALAPEKVRYALLSKLV